MRGVTNRRGQDGPDIRHGVLLRVGRIRGDGAAVDLGGLVLVDRDAVVAAGAGGERKGLDLPVKTRTVVAPPSATDSPNSVPRSTTLPRVKAP